MAEYGKMLLFAMPAFLVLVIIEKVYGIVKKKDTVPLDDAISSMSSGMSNVLKDVLGLTFKIIAYAWLVEHLAIYKIENTILVYVVAFVVIDFYGYWKHRVWHHVNLFWNEHVIHHSSEEFNLACALRQPVSIFFDFFEILLIPAALLGVPAEVIAVVLPLHLFMQFWYHTQHMGKLGILEYIIVTPSHHRVHHAINPEYLDKNLSQIFIVWDFLFGTFQEELDDVPPVYGVSRPARTWNPYKINFQHLWILIKDAWRAPKFMDKLTIWFRPTGWRPDGFDDKYPVDKIDDVYDFEKYRPKIGTPLLIWSIVQLLLMLAFLSDLFYRIGDLSFSQILMYAGFIFIALYTLSDLMDRNRWSWVFELVKLGYVFVVFYVVGSWFGHQSAIYMVMVYAFVSFVMSIFFSMEQPTPSSYKVRS